MYDWGPIMSSDFIMAQATGAEWLRLTAQLILVADGDFLCSAWRVSENILDVRSKILSREVGDLRIGLSVAQGLVEVAVKERNESLLDSALIAAARVLAVDSTSGRFGIVGMMILLCPPLARAETFELVSNRLRKVPSAG
jgi:hypothetical protein